jgi:hypothetical protein
MLGDGASRTRNRKKTWTRRQNHFKIHPQLSSAFSDGDLSMSKIVGQLFNDVENPEFEDRRETIRRTSMGRREEELDGGRCAIHDVERKLLDERCQSRKNQCDKNIESQTRFNETIEIKVRSIDNKLNWILGAAFILWPMLQILVPYALKSMGVGK